MNREQMLALRSSLDAPEVYDFMHSFFDIYYRQRDPEPISERIREDMVFIGLGADDLCRSGAEFMRYTRSQMEELPDPVPYQVTDYLQKSNGPDTWIVMARVQLRVCTGDWGRVDYNMRLTAHLRREEGVLRITSLHISEPMDSRVRPAAGTELIHSGEEGQTAAVQRKLSQIMDQLVPGGVISCYIAENYPLAAATQQVLTMAGYETYSEFSRVTDGCYLNAIHPEDRKRFAYNVRFAQKSGKQCECEYRILKQDGTYLWVHEMSRRTVAEDGREMMVSALFNISDQMERRQRLEMETGIDALTGVFNRKGALRRIAGQSLENRDWMFFVGDLDNFKQVNDFYGHKQGDQILCYIAEQLSEGFGDTGTVFRLGGDEFALFVAGSPEPEKVIGRVEAIARRYAALLGDVCPKAHSTLSVGGVCGKGPAPFEEMYEKADANLYRVKHTGKGRLFLSHV